ncbi:amino acid adenylation domain-containing protein [Pseudomonas sp. S75]|uniref:non-ribosomal peptide synthetase n=1 Tax=unclassified Pseudomonas TaxID=196821 RepID=UPI0019047F7C|nr:MULTISPECIES: non-ribosomal peptide synthetase [unclassified Pseudomonas]MBJ9977630.1 amino acid adenylation domain-containing protein [Pseudomonas sp. S30]MBK0155002.1 amino acid adenylation domain-containing protein [Pseudomonas sp. S75]
MSATALLNTLTSAGLALEVEQGNLKLRGPSEAITDDLVQAIKAQKPALIHYLEAVSTAFPLTPLQGAYVRGRSAAFELGGVSNQVYHEIDGEWDIERLQDALAQVSAAHSALRSRVLDEHRQSESSAGLELLVSDWQHLDAPQQQVQRAEKRAALSALTLPLDGPLVRVEVAVLDHQRRVLFVNHDGLVMDGISMFLFFDALHRCYEGGTLAADQLVFRDHVQAIAKDRDGPAYTRSKAYWLARLADLPAAPRLALPNGAGTQVDHRFTQRSVTLDPAQWDALQQRCRDQGLTPSAALLFAWSHVLAQWGAGDRFTLNVTVANRRPMHPAAYTAIGPFSDPMLVHVELPDSLTLAQAAAALQARLHTDLDHRHFSGIEVMQALARTAGGPGAASMPFTFNSTVGALGGVDGTALTLLGTEVFSVSQTPQVLLDVFVMEQRGQLVIRLDAVESRFHPGMLDAMTQGYALTLQQLTAKATWAQRTLDLLPATQRAKRAAANATTTPLTRQWLGDALLEAASTHNQAPAIITRDATLSYQEVFARASAAAAWLQRQGVQRNELVAVHARKGPEQIIGIVACVLAGAAYLPVDVALPQNRKAYMLDHAGVRCVLVDGAYADERLHLRLDQTLPAQALPARPAGVNGDDLAYVLYTSGTTGEPKGVMVTHRNVANLVADCARRFGIAPTDRFFAISAFNFDLSVWDIFASLSSGAALVLPDHDRVADPEHWRELGERGGVTVWNSVPSVVQMLLDHGCALPSQLRLVMMSGDKIPVTLAARLAESRSDIRLVSLGGPTETTIWNMVHEIARSDLQGLSIPYGRPNANNTAHVRDAANRDCPEWVAGEICSGGAGVTPGYLGDEARTAQRYGWDERSGERLFRTGDRGRYLPDGNIEILGRIDHQLKVNGYRVEAAEVEARLAEVDGIRQAVVVVCHEPHGATLVAHLVPSGSALEPAAIRAQLSRDLPDYMVPARYVWHASLPRNRNDKIDRTALSEFTAQASAAPPAPDEQAPCSQVMRDVLDIWANVLGRPQAEIDTAADFFASGGSSMAAVRVLTQVRKTFGIGLPLDALYQYNSVQALARQLSAQIAEKEAAAR